jgi:demethylmenaquinone methyltransferase/2-methoxy-6-polyprenyl-1,4-benzoquinol methylase
MIQLATAKKAANGLSLGDACRLPVQSQTLDAVTVGWGIRNVPDIDAAHLEIARVLKPGGKFVSLDMARPQNPILGLSSKFAMNHLVPLIGRLFGKAEAYTYLPKSTEKFYSREELSTSMRGAGLVEVGWKNLFFGNVCIHWGTKP